ncbi:uncharacterized protein [Narcine bancroftii]|uniref:uncharacterized protein isoform X2 n=1 Tax=Narcine bancroftii TaxID=1343680 RepID=UPI003831B164
MKERTKQEIIMKLEFKGSYKITSAKAVSSIVDVTFFKEKPVHQRFIKPIHLEDYKRWLSSQITDTKDQSDLAAEDMTNDFEKLLRQTPSFLQKNDSSTAVETTKINHKPQTAQQTNTGDAGIQFQISKEIKGKVADKPTENSQKKQPRENKAVGYLVDSSAVTTVMTGGNFSLSFPQVLHLVQSGQEIPGIQKLNIMSTNSMPTISQMARKPKPWESN